MGQSTAELIERTLYSKAPHRGVARCTFSKAPHRGVARCTFCGCVTATYESRAADDLAACLDPRVVTISPAGELREQSGRDPEAVLTEVEWPCERCYGRFVDEELRPSRAHPRVIWKWRRAAILRIGWSLGIRMEGEDAGWCPGHDDLESCLKYVLTPRYVEGFSARSATAFPHWRRVTERGPREGEWDRDIDSVLCLASLRLR